MLLSGSGDNDLSASTAKLVEKDHSSDRQSASAVNELPTALSHPSPDTILSAAAAPLVSPPYQSEVVIPAIGSPVGPLASPSPGRCSGAGSGLTHASLWDLSLIHI